MARPRQKNIVERLADAGEEAIQRLGSAPGADKVLGALGSMRERVDDLQKRVRGLENLEKRLKAVERRLDKLEGKGKMEGKGKTSTRKTSSTAKRSTTPKSPS
jgi:TolA-binding protein